MDLSILTATEPVLPPPPGQTTNFDQPLDEQRDVAFTVTLGVFFAISTICVLLRLWTRAMVVRQFGWDDGFTLVAFILNLPFTAAVLELRAFGLTSIDWNIRQDWLYIYEPSYNYWNGTGWIIFCFIYAMVKLSILALYLRILGKTHPNFRIAVYAMMVVIVGVTIGPVADFLSWCQPVAKSLHDELPGTCIFNSNLFFVQAVLAVTTDFMVLLPPIPFIWQTSWTTSRKIGFLSLIAFALCITAIAFFRTVAYAPGVWRYEYEMYDQFYQTLFYILEINGAIIAICLPILSQLFRHVRWQSNPGSSPALDAREELGKDVNASDPSSGGASTPRHLLKPKKRSPISRVIYALASRDMDHTVSTENDGIGDTEKAGTGFDSTDTASGNLIRSPEEPVVWQGGSGREGLHTIRGQRYER